MTEPAPAFVQPYVNPLLAELLLLPHLADPYPLYHRWRRGHPVHFAEPGFWTLTRYEDVLAVLRDDRFSADPRRATALAPAPGGASQLRPFEEMAGLVLLFTDPPDHTRLRTLVSKAFTPRAVEALAPHIEALVGRLLDRTAPAGGMDVIADFAYPLPALVICELMGVPPEDRDRFKGLSAEVAPLLDPVTPPPSMQRALGALGQFVLYFSGLIDERRRHPRDDLLSALIAAEQDGDRLTTPELYALCVLLFIAGHETTQNLIGNGLLALLRHPEQLALLRERPELMRGAVEELLRYDSPVQLTARAARCEAEVGGVTIPEGHEVVALIGAANRDPEVFFDPDRLDVMRQRPQVLSFGAGIHFCLGAPLARLEARIAFSALLERFPRLELATDNPPWRPTLTLRGLASLPVRFG